MEQNQVPPQPLPTHAESPRRGLRTSLINAVSWVRDLVFSVLIAIVLIYSCYRIRTLEIRYSTE